MFKKECGKRRVLSLHQKAGNRRKDVMQTIPALHRSNSSIRWHHQLWHYKQRENIKLL